MFTKHPLSIGLTLLIQTILISLILGFYNLNYWYSYILTLIIVGGILILFIYITRIASNEKFKFNIKLVVIIILTLLIISIIIINFTDRILRNFYYKIRDYQTLNFNDNYHLQIRKYYNFPSNLILITIIIYLLICLIAVVKISKTNQGPLRQIF